MKARRLLPFLLLAALWGLLTACQTSSDALLATQGFGHFNAKSVEIGLDGGGSAILTQAIDPSTGALPIRVSGSAQGIGNDEYTLLVEAKGDPLLTCTNQGQHQAPGQNPIFVSSNESGVDNTSGDKKGRYPFDASNGGALTPEAVTAYLSAIQPFPCPNDNWTLRLDFIFWTGLDLYLVDPNGLVTDELHYTCTTTRQPAAISCSRLR